MNTLILLFYKIAAFFTSIRPHSRDNTPIHPDNNSYTLKDTGPVSSESLICPGKYIDNQSLLGNIRYGKYDFAYSGCGPIALYNALLSLGTSPDISEITAYLEKYGMPFFGKFGTAPNAIRRFIESHGFTVVSLRDNSPDTINIFGNKFDTFLSVIYNDRKTLKKGLHIICVIRDENGAFTSRNPYFTAHTLHDVLGHACRGPVKCVITYGISKPV